MKKRASICCALLCVALAAGCSGQGMQTPGTSQASGGENASQTPQAGGDTSEQASGQENDIGAGQATAIALKDAGLQESDVHLVKQKLEMEDGRTAYEIEFYSGEKSYDYEIDAATGEILSRDFDIESSLPSEGNAPGSQAGTAVTLEQAKEAALAQAGLAGQEVRWKKEELDRDDGRMVYELEFVSGQMEYEYKIDAENGNVLEYDKEYWDD